jgi:hypothetical protein
VFVTYNYFQPCLMIVEEESRVPLEMKHLNNPKTLN